LLDARLEGLCPACLLEAVLPAGEAVGPRERTLPHIDGYELIEEIGAGGMGVVYKARAARTRSSASSRSS
jgi:serine/threonine protein kinase